MLRKDPSKRITPEDALKHPFFPNNGFEKYAEKAKNPELDKKVD